MTESSRLTAEGARTTELELYSGIEFFERLAGDISETSSGDRVVILTMSFGPGEPLVANIIDELHASADRGTDIVIGVDAYALMADGDSRATGPLLFPMPFGQASFIRRRREIDRLAGRDSVRCSIINRPSRYLTNPFAGRSHIKLAIVNDKVKIGGPNFHKSDRDDIVVEFENPETADMLYELARCIVETGSTDEALDGQDQAWPMDGKTTIMIDAGMRNQSLIFETALQIIEDARKSIIGSFQFFPNGKTADSFIRAYNRDIRTRLIHNHPFSGGKLLGGVEYLAMLRQKSRMPSALFADQVPRGRTMHGSAIASETAVVVGSHNLVERGVKFGTAELAILSRDPDFAHQVGNFILSQVQGRVEL